MQGRGTQKRDATRQRRIEAGIVRASLKVHTDHENNSFTVWLNGLQEWMRLQEAIRKPELTKTGALRKHLPEGFKGTYFSLPPGTHILLARLEEPEAIPGYQTLPVGESPAP